jgi:hypothetical protein
MSIEWRIYYADGTTFDSTQGEPWDAPGTRVIIILQRHHDVREKPYFVWRGDYYLWKHDRWYAVDYGALLQYWFQDQLHLKHHRASLSGETVDNPTWTRITELAGKDPDFFG